MIAEKYPYLPGYTMEAGVYKGQDKPVLVNADWAICAVNKEVDEDFVYNVVKAVMGNPEELATGPKALKVCRTRNMLCGIRAATLSVKRWLINPFWTISTTIQENV